jgi:hypothetical protein
VRYSKGFFPSPTKILKDELRAAAAEKRGEDTDFDSVVECDRCKGSGEYKGAKCLTCKGVGTRSVWRLLEIAPLPRDEQGQIDKEVAQEQYKRLIAERVSEVNSEPVRLSKSGKQVLAFMMLESSRLGEVANV